MKPSCEGKSIELETKIVHGDGFVNENYMIKGIEKHNNFGFKTIGEGILKSLTEAGDDIAQIDVVTGDKKTFKGIKELGIRLALWMKKEGIGSEDVVTLCSPHVPDVEIIIIAIFFVGVIYNAFPDKLDLSSARSYIRHIEPRIVFTCKNKIDILREAAALENHTCKIIVLGKDNNCQSLDEILKMQLFSEIENFQVNEVDLKSACFIMPTSGTTGTPKFPIHSCETLMSHLSFIRDKTSSLNDITLIYLSPSWAAYLLQMLSQLIQKSTIIFDGDFEPRKSFRVIEKYKVTKLFLNGYKVLIYCYADESHKYDLGSVSEITSSGNALSTKLIEKMHKVFPNAYLYRQLGSSEVGWITRYTEKCCNPQSQGTILPNRELKIVDVKSGQTLGLNKTGEICVKSPSVMICYYKNPEETAVMYDDEGWFHTGDVGYYDENGEIVFVGRLKEIINFRGINIQVNYVEQILMSHPDIFAAAVVAIHCDFNVEQPVACIQRAQGSKITEGDVLKLISEVEFKNAFENWIIFVDELPRGSNEKVNKRILGEQLEKTFAKRNLE